MPRVLVPISLLIAASTLSAQDSLQVRLNASPRHQEWIKIASGSRQVHTFVVFPEVAHRALAVVVLHENRGLTDWVRGVADRLAEAGYIALVPDLLSGMGPGGGGTEAFAVSDSARQAIYQLPPAQIAADLGALLDHAQKIPAANGKVAVAGFCWGGARTFELATQRADLAAAFVFYGTGPDSTAIEKITAPVYGFYGGNDTRVNATVPQITTWMQKAGKRYEPVMYDSAGHGFLRSGEAPDASAADQKARAAAWSRWLELLQKL